MEASQTTSAKGRYTMSDGAEFIHEGFQYLKTARNGHKRKKVFNNELVFSLIGLSVEKLLVGLCMQRGANLRQGRSFPW
jgi:hypothetical protein